MKERDILIHLVRSGLTYLQYRLLMEAYTSLLDAYVDNYDLLPKIKDKYDNIEQLEPDDIDCVSLLDREYPKALQALDKPPLVLWYKGDLAILNNSSLGVVGSRAMHRHTQRVLEDLIPPIARQGVVVVSGLAFGVDTYAHQLAVDCEGHCVAVLGGGLDTKSFHPKSNLKLSEQIAHSGGLVITEYPPGTTPTRYTFPQRNRIIAALSHKLLVAQAGLGSGSLITAQLAGDLEKDIISPSVDYFESSFAGNRQLISEGARVIGSPRDLLSLYNILKTGVTRSNLCLTLPEVLKKFDIIANPTAELTKLEMIGKVRPVEDGLYIVID